VVKAPTIWSVGVVCVAMLAVFEMFVMQSMQNSFGLDPETIVKM
jgi:uncharacterized membrane protein YhaH (DUF805 family)